MKKVVPVNKAAQKAFKSLPREIGIAFSYELDLIASGESPEMDIEHLRSVGPGVIELKINGHPAYRCVYCNKDPDFLYLLHAFAKTSDGPDRKNMDTTKLRYKSVA